MAEKNSPSEPEGAKRGRKGNIPAPTKHKSKVQPLPPYRPTALPPPPPKHPHHSPTPNRRGR
jgi:hypothetical protein